MTLKNFKVLGKEELKLVLAGSQPDCEAGSRRVVDGVVYCDYYDVDPNNTDQLDDCLMGN
mgnify:CR=1 FL=1